MAKKDQDLVATIKSLKALDDIASGHIQTTAATLGATELARLKDITTVFEAQKFPDIPTIKMPDDMVLIDANKALQDVAKSVSIQLTKPFQEIGKIGVQSADFVDISKFASDFVDISKIQVASEFVDMSAFATAFTLPTMDIRAMSALASDEMVTNSVDAAALWEFAQELDNERSVSEWLAGLSDVRQRATLIRVLNALVAVAAYIEAQAGVQLPAHLLLLLSALLSIAVMMSSEG